MPSLVQSLQNHDLGFLQIAASLWGVELGAQDTGQAADELAAALLDPDLVIEVLTSLGPEARSALAALTGSHGRLPWAAFARQYGPVREMGIARRDREKPYLAPASGAEALFYRALLFRAFFDSSQGPQELAYVPDDLLELVGAWEQATGARPESAPAAGGAARPEPPGRGATPGEKKHVLPASDRILDDATTLLAALRSGRALQADPKLPALLRAAGLLSGAGGAAASKSGRKPAPGSQLKAERVKAFLEAARPAALQMLVDGWRASETFDELRLLPGLIFEGDWKNQPRLTRDFLLDLLTGIPPGTWWSLNAFIAGVKKSYPDYQRPAGDYDAWFIKRAADGAYLRGFAYWDQVDGALLRFYITDVLYALGRLELASAEPGGPPGAFHMLEAAPRGGEENGRIAVASNGSLSVPRSVPRAVRYQLARFCEWDEERPEVYRYHLTPRSLAGAQQQGLKVEHLLSLLGRHAEAGIPPVLVKALQRWDENGTEARAETQVILRVSRPEVLEELHKSRAARFLGEPLGPTSVVIKAGAQARVMAALAELGLLAEDATRPPTEEP